MQIHLLVGPIPHINGCHGFSTIEADFSILHSPSSYRSRDHHRQRRPYGKSRPCRRPWETVTAASSSSYSSRSSPSPATISGGQNHYAVLGIARSATPADIKRAYRLLARKFHPDVSKDSRAGELFKSIHRAYEALSNEATRIQYDRALKHQEDAKSYRVKRHHTPESEDEMKFCRWAETRWKARYGRFYRYYYTTNSNSHIYDETDNENQEENTKKERDPFSKVLKSAFISILLLKTLGTRVSLTFSSLMALFDKELDAGYKIGYVIAWILGGKGGILLTLCLSFASWICGKASSGMVVVVVVALWVGSNLARHAPLPQGALLTLLYMSIKLQVDQN